MGRDVEGAGGVPGRIRKAPENFLSAADIAAVASGRRDVLRRGFAAALGLGAAAAAGAARADDPDILDLPPWSTTLGLPVAATPYGMPSRYERNLVRRQSPGLTQVGAASVAFTPLQGSFGIVTPSGLHFERHHQGWTDIDPRRHRFMVNGSRPGMVARPMVFTMDDLMRLPSVSRMHFLECGANTGMEWGNVAVPTVQYTHGMVSCSEFTGVELRVLLEMCGADLSRGRFVLAEGADGSSMTRTIPMELVASGEVLVAWGQNGEMLRPENGYPLRLVVPGVQGVSWVKYLRRIEVGDQPYGAKDEVLHYVDLMPDGRHRQYTSIQECKSVVTTPSGGQVLLDRGYYNISGLAWSGRGRIRRVDVSVDGGAHWRTARLETPVLSKCLTRFNIDWAWDGRPALIQSRATDDTGHVQPTYRQLRAVRGTRSIYHNNAVQTWLVQESGEVKNVQLS
jgi:sulfane dehydrogenase subunit SoxC